MAPAFSIEDVRRELAELPDRCRRAVELFYGDGLTQDDVAAEMGITQPVVSLHLARARQSIPSLPRPMPKGRHRTESLNRIA